MSTQKNETEVRSADSSQHRISFVAILFFVLFIIAAATLFIVAVVIWLGDILGSIALSSLIFGGAAAIVALLFYLISVRRSVQTLHDYFETVYDTSRLAKSGYEQVKSWIDLIFG